MIAADSRPGRYVPTPAERQKVKLAPGQVLLSSHGIFATLQGEGVPPSEGGSQGLNALFCRLNICNLSCLWCDVKESWQTSLAEFWQGSCQVATNVLAEEIRALWESTNWAEFAHLPGAIITASKRLVLTGGEPTLQKREVGKLIHLLPDFSFEVETNGKINPFPELVGAQINCSPKLRSSNPNRRGTLYSSEALAAINDAPKSFFKFVVATSDDLMAVEKIVSENRLSPEKVLIMAEGVGTEVLNSRQELVRAAIQKNGWRESKRMHIYWFGNKKRT